MSVNPRVEALLAAPAGRLLLAELAGVSFPWLLGALDLPFPPNMVGLAPGVVPAKEDPATGPRWRSLWRSQERAAAVHRAAVEGALPDDVAAAVRHLRMTRVEVENGGAVLQAFANAIRDFGFAGNEKEYDHLLRAAVDELRPVAQALVASPVSSWWWDDVLRQDQRYLQLEEGDGPSRGSDVTKAVEELNSQEAEARRRFPSPDDAPQNLSGRWSSIPTGLVTSRPVPPAPALHFACAETFFADRAVVWSVGISPTAKVFEVREPSDWARLVEMAPVDVTMSRLGDWRRWTERNGPFYLPDWSVIAQEFDGVHVTVGGYLTTRSVPVPVTNGYSVLAGWDPDVTLWLRDVVELTERLGEWELPLR